MSDPALTIRRLYHCCRIRSRMGDLLVGYSLCIVDRGLDIPQDTVLLYVEDALPHLPCTPTNARGDVHIHHTPTALLS
jgi:hypothetical protein